MATTTLESPLSINNLTPLNMDIILPKNLQEFIEQHIRPMLHENVFVDIPSIADLGENTNQSTKFINDLESFVTKTYLKKPSLAYRYEKAWRMTFDDYSIIFDVDHNHQILSLLVIAKTGLE